MLLTLGAWPTDSLTKAASVSFFVIVVALNLVWITVKIILWSHGYRGWFNATRDMRRLRELALGQTDSTVASAYNILRNSWQTLFILLFVLPLILLTLSWLTQHSH
jgi:hypothetical protein